LITKTKNYEYNLFYPKKKGNEVNKNNSSVNIRFVARTPEIL